MTPYQRRVLEQTERWVEGDARHNVVDDECCPDFSCCRPELFTLDPEERQRTLWRLRKRLRHSPYFAALRPPAPQPQLTGGWELGRTSRQMIDAPNEAIYVWPTEDLDYPRDLALHLGRLDLTIRPRSWLRYGLRGHRRGPVILDHELVDRAEYREWEAWLRYVASR